jgi:HD-GYP domain-containing protein (c-di-GMP phosphodiesterase class II)
LNLMIWDRNGDRFRSHNRMVIKNLELVGGKLGLTPLAIKTLHRAAVFHDATKVLLGDVDKAGRLDASELFFVFDHPSKLNELMAPFDFLAEERTVLLRHHERYDGNGYPDGLEGDEIPFGARIFAIVDAFAAMTSKRSYRRQLSAGDAVKELAANAGTQFDPILVGVFIDALKESTSFAIADENVASAKAKLDEILDESKSALGA